MRWLIITNDTDLSKSVETKLIEADKKNKLVSCSFNTDEIISNKKNFKELAACLIYTDNQKELSAEQVAVLSSIQGYFAYDKITLITNLSCLLENKLFPKDGLLKVESKEELLSLISKKYKKTTEASVQRLAKNKLLKRGIPFTSDCFATYIAKNKIEIFNEFLEAGMEVNVRDDLGTPMLNIACRNDNFEFVEMLLDLGADLNASSEDRGYTAVMDAIWRGNEKITKYLISKGADLNTINKEGQTNLILAVGADRLNLVQLLAENGADPDVKDGMGMSAYSYATLFRKEKIAEVLKPYHKE